MLGQWLHPNRQFTDESAAAGDNRLGQLAMLAGINDVNAAAEHREGLAVSVQRALMRLAVDAAGQPADHGEAFGGELEAQSLGHSAADVAGGARADDRDTGRVVKV